MNMKKFFIIIFCVLGVSLALMSGVLLASRLIEPMMGGDDIVLDDPVGPRTNVLFIGVDDGGARSDTIMLVSLDSEHKSLSILSIPRDTIIKWGGYNDKITHVIGYKGAEQNTIDAVKGLLGVPVNYYVKLSFEGFRNVIDILDGVEVTVPNVGGSGGMYYSDPYQNLDISLKAGTYVLNGKQAEGFVRYRSGYPEADIARTRAQQDFVRALVNQKLKPKYIGKVDKLFKEVKANVKTNYSALDVAKYIPIIKDMTDESIFTATLPGRAMPVMTRYGEVSGYVPNMSEVNALVDEHFKSGSGNTGN